MDRGFNAIVKFRQFKKPPFFLHWRLEFMHAHSHTHLPYQAELQLGGNGNLDLY